MIVSRDWHGALHAFENRCAHRGALICLGEGGRGRRIQCVYHAWSYDLEGNLRGVAFENGIDGAGGMPEGFDKARHGPHKLRVAAYCGLVFGTFSPDVPDLEPWLGPEICARLARVAGQAGPAARPPPPDAAEQLEALCREREGQLPRKPAAFLLRHIPV